MTNNEHISDLLLETVDLLNEWISFHTPSLDDKLFAYLMETMSKNEKDEILEKIKEIDKTLIDFANEEEQILNIEESKRTKEQRMSLHNIANRSPELQKQRKKLRDLLRK